MHFHTFDTFVALSTGRRLWPLRCVCLCVEGRVATKCCTDTVETEFTRTKKKKVFLNYMSTLLLLLLLGKAIAAAVAAAIAVAAVTAAAVAATAE